MPVNYSDGIEQAIEAFARLGAAAFLAVIIILFLRAKRRTTADLLLGAVFTIWFIVIVFGAARFLLHYPPARLPWPLYLGITALELWCSVAMIREAAVNRRLNDERGLVSARERVVGKRERVATDREAVLADREDAGG